MSVPNGWIDNAVPKSWGIIEDREQFEVEFTTPHGSIRWWGGLKSEASIGYTEKQLRKIGWSGDWSNMDIRTEPVSILVEEREHNGKLKQEVKAFGGGSGGPRAVKDPGKAASLVARLKARSGGASSADPFGNAPVWDGTGREPGDDL